MAVMDTPGSAPLIGKLVVFGMGLIGGSFAAGLKKRGACGEVIAIVRSAATGEEVLAAGLADRFYLSVEAVAAELDAGDMIFIAVPTLAVEQVLQAVQTWVSDAVTVTDGASVKGSVVAAARAVYGRMPPQLVPGHPIAGSEKSGVTAANADLYERHRVILTPLEETAPAHVERVTRAWQALGAEVVSMSVSEHDQVLGATSHLPHAIAYALVDTLAHDIGNPNIFRYAAGGFRDFTRIASSDPVMWHDIMCANREAVVQALDQFIDNLNRMQAAIAAADGDYLLEVFTRAKDARDHFTRMLAQRATGERR